MAFNSKVYDVITNKIVDMLETGVVPWHKPWDAEEGCPKNLVSKYPYRGINPFLLGAMPFKSPWWLSYKQVKQLGGSIKDEELKESTPVVFFKWPDTRQMKQHETDKENEDEQDDEDYDIIKGFQVVKQTRRYPIIRYYRVYNVEQCSGLEKYIPEPISKMNLNPIEECEKVSSEMRTKPSIRHGGDKAYYSPALDIIQIPVIESFNAIEDYYSTKFHELTHSTGHKDRLNRKGVADVHAFGDPIYSLEELVAEMGASFLCSMTGIENKTIDNSASYLSNWLKKLHSDSKLVVIAGSQAQKACDYILNKTGGV